MSFQRSAGIRPVIPTTQTVHHSPLKKGLISALALILRITWQTVSQAAVDGPLSPLRGLKPRCYGADTSEHSGHRAVISCWVCLEEADTI